MHKRFGVSYAFVFAALVGGFGLAATAGVLEETPAVPSGYDVTLQEERLDDLGGTKVLRLRYVAPEIAAEGHQFDDVAEDFEHLCTTQGLPRVAELGGGIEQVVVSLSDQETDFGVSNSDATQYFEAFTLETDICIWEAF